MPNEVLHPSVFALRAKQGYQGNFYLVLMGRAQSSPIAPQCKLGGAAYNGKLPAKRTQQNVLGSTECDRLNHHLMNVVALGALNMVYDVPYPAVRVNDDVLRARLSYKFDMLAPVVAKY
jgi:hypothetical protein